MGVVENNLNVARQENGAVDVPDVFAGTVIMTGNNDTVCAVTFRFGYGVLDLFGVGCAFHCPGLNVGVHREHFLFSDFGNEFFLFIVTMPQAKVK